MSTSTISQHSRNPMVPRSAPGHSALRRPALDLLVEKLARRLLAWSEARAEAELQAQPDHDRMALIRENEALRVWAGSAFGR